MKGDLDLQKIPTLILIPKKRALRKKVVMMKDEGCENAGKIIVIITETEKTHERKGKKKKNPLTCQSHIFYNGPLNETRSL